MSYTNGLDKPSDYFNTKLYAGNSSTQSITGVGFQPDLVWLKDRTTTATDHLLQDVIRGAQYNIRSNSTRANDDGGTGNVTSFDSDGFTLGSGAYSNASGDNYVAWNWLADNTSGSSNTDGSITSTVSANTTSGFSIVKYVGISPTAGTVGHGLGVAPKVILFKNLDRITNWDVYHYSTGAGNRLYLNATDASTPATNYMNNTAPTSSVFSVEDADDTNKLNDNIIAYCFAEKKGFSKFGSYIGNGSASDGTFVYTGFRPAFVIVKASSRIGDWYIMDNKRDTVNSIDLSLSANSSNADNNQGNFMDFYSNGFKLFLTGTGLNESGSTYTYMAFADLPLVSSSGVPCTAR